MFIVYSGAVDYIENTGNNKFEKREMVSCRGSPKEVAFSNWDSSKNKDMFIVYSGAVDYIENNN